MHVLTRFDFNWLQLMFLYKVIRRHLVSVPLDLVIPYFHGIKSFLPDDIAFGIILIVNSDLHSHFHVVDAVICMAVDHKAVNLDVILNWNIDYGLIV